MADSVKIGVMNSETGQRTLESIEDVTVVNVQNEILLSELPAEFDHVIRIAAANGMKRVAAISHNTLLADAMTPILEHAVLIGQKSDKSQFSALSILGAHGRSNGSTTNPIDAPTNAPTNYGVLAAILGADANATNAKQNATAANVNAIAANLNALSTQFNALLTWLGFNQNAINNLRMAGAT